MPAFFPADFAKARVRIRAGFYLPDKKVAPSSGTGTITGS
jgi:hypothetical protein